MTNRPQSSAYLITSFTSPSLHPPTHNNALLVIGKYYQAHHELAADHQVTDIMTYRKQKFSDHTRHCRKHKSEPLTLACKSRWNVFCPLCMSTAADCPNGKLQNRRIPSLTAVVVLDFRSILTLFW